MNDNPLPAALACLVDELRSPGAIFPIAMVLIYGNGASRILTLPPRYPPASGPAPRAPARPSPEAPATEEEALDEDAIAAKLAAARGNGHGIGTSDGEGG